MSKIVWLISLLYFFSPVGASGAPIQLQESDHRIVLHGDCSQILRDIGSLQKYRKSWDGQDVAIPSLNRQGSSCRADITPLLPPEMLKLNGQFWVDGVGGFGNCHGSSSYFAKLSPLLTHRETMDIRFAECKSIPFKEVQAGDLGLIFSDEEFVSHSFTVLTKDVVFTKNGHQGEKKPYRFMNIEEMADIYYSFHTTDDPKSPTINHYREDLKNGLDCLRGTPEEIAVCADELSHPRTFYFRCDSLEQMEKVDAENLTPDYFSYKKRVAELVKFYSQDKNQYLSPDPVKVVEISNLVKDYRHSVEQQVRIETLTEKIWTQLGTPLFQLQDMLSADSELRKVIFADEKN